LAIYTTYFIGSQNPIHLLQGEGKGYEGVDGILQEKALKLEAFGCQA
jgi:hypothetical protein